MADDSHVVWTRRDFMRGTLGAAIAPAVLGQAADPARAALPARPGRSAVVTIVRDRDVLGPSHDVNRAILRRMIGDAVMRQTGAPSPRAAWQSLFKPADVVGLVPTAHLNPTHGEVVDAVRDALADAGVPADRVREANHGAEQARACTALVALPALKAHWLTGLGTVLKNYILYSENPSRYHGERNANLGEIWLLPGVKGKTRLVLVDALRPLCDKGPQVDPRYLWDYKGVIVGTDPVAVETIGLQIITEKRRVLRGEPWPLSPPPLSVAAADERYGLGTSRLSEIKVQKAGWAEEALV